MIVVGVVGFELGGIGGRLAPCFPVALADASYVIQEPSASLLVER